MWKDVILLGKPEEQPNYEQPDIPNEWRQVFANKKSVRQSEFYQAAGVGMKPELVFEIMSIEYADNRYIKHDDRLYTIIRTYVVGDVMELVVSLP